MSEMKNVLLLGDSRRQGYEPFVRKILEGTDESSLCRHLIPQISHIIKTIHITKIAI